ncbi:MULTISPECIES: hypothetical protein [Mycolicibacter]|uniref:ESX-1 secretion-associated protein n=1 Tax=Mycolicibacter longobardus TaxID=1108812 RepID=A0A1X1YC09_9MYCO|nr:MULTISPECIES: hypothetical protein [Mycolicibacter]ORW08530.1 hypothetical protein AWC16_19220 [Mycolicibacter longobardus]RAV04358.1 hypothetical protein DQP56_00640 [Mycolicibacter senuensis]
MIIKLTSGEMRSIANAGHSSSVDFMQTYAQFANLADELAAVGMQGLAGPAVAAKVAELKAKVDQHSATAQEKFHGIGHFADMTDQAEAERQGRIFAITSL